MIVRTDEDMAKLDDFLNGWTCERGGRHRVYTLCNCPCMGLDTEALKRGFLQVAPIPGYDDLRAAMRRVAARRKDP